MVINLFSTQSRWIVYGKQRHGQLPSWMLMDKGQHCFRAKRLNASTTNLHYTRIQRIKLYREENRIIRVYFIDQGVSRPGTLLTLPFRSSSLPFININIMGEIRLAKQALVGEIGLCNFSSPENRWKFRFPVARQSFRTTYINWINSPISSTLWMNLFGDKANWENWFNSSFVGTAGSSCSRRIWSILLIKKLLIEFEWANCWIIVARRPLSVHMGMTCDGRTLIWQRPSTK